MHQEKSGNPDCMVAAGAKNKQEKSPLCLLSSSPFF
jgi:hypothetical protein